ncbi:MAG: hypothetical protein KME06_02775 [Kastovskya adunca ATA6-11-RM4]|nr:hypothetical protein [Kastovskya adunca ATA6-11-RM4]
MSFAESHSLTQAIPLDDIRYNEQGLVPAIAHTTIRCTLKPMMVMTLAADGL